MHRAASRKIQERSTLSSQDNQTARILVMRIPKSQATTSNGLMSRMSTRTKSGVQSVEIQVMWKAFSALQKSSNVKLVTSLDTLPASVVRKIKFHSSQESQRHINYKQGLYMQKKVPYAVNLKITAQVRIPFACRSKCSAVHCTQANLQKIPKPAHLITNLAYRLKSHHARNFYLRARLDTCMDVNIMPASLY